VSRTALLGAAVVLSAACSEDRAAVPVSPVFDPDVANILGAHCVSCHGDVAPAAGWRATTFLSTLGCVEPSGAPATTPAAAAPILAALDVTPHRGLLNGDETATLRAWVYGHTPPFAGTVHPAGIVDPRSPDFHGTLLRSQRWAPMLDGNDPNACSRCHDGVPARVAGVTRAAPGATACTSCHSQPHGVLDCATCHGSGARSYPPRDLCFFPGDAKASGAHAAHVQPSPVNSAGLACSTCHPVPGPEVVGGAHGNGTVDVVFDPMHVAPGASYDRATGACSVSCHDRGGASPHPLWSDAFAMGCSSCHASPPANHYPGPCTNCHAEANATGTALTGGPLHMNGRVDLGDGSGQCGACHGSGSSPWPSSAAHPAHQNPTLTVATACASCHPVPSTLVDPVHLDGVVHVSFGGLALARNSSPVWDGSTCTSVACHGANLPNPPAVVPSWKDTTRAASKCGACHGVPPLQHTPSTECSRSDCHGSEVDIGAGAMFSITPSGKSLHIDGIIESAR
jgi:predicted CxxxxCH...CXXCH cytochrome family protein